MDKPIAGKTRRDGGGSHGDVLPLFDGVESTSQDRREDNRKIVTFGCVGGKDEMTERAGEFDKGFRIEQKV